MHKSDVNLCSSTDATTIEEILAAYPEHPADVDSGECDGGGDTESEAAMAAVGTDDSTHDGDSLCEVDVAVASDDVPVGAVEANQAALPATSISENIEIILTDVRARLNALNLKSFEYDWERAEILFDAFNRLRAVDEERGGASWEALVKNEFGHGRRTAYDHRQTYAYFQEDTQRATLALKVGPRYGIMRMVQAWKFSKATDGCGEGWRNLQFTADDITIEVKSPEGTYTTMALNTLSTDALTELLRKAPKAPAAREDKAAKIAALEDAKRTLELELVTARETIALDANRIEQLALDRAALISDVETLEATVSALTAENDVLKSRIAELEANLAESEDLTVLVG